MKREQAEKYLNALTNGRMCEERQIECRAISRREKTLFDAVMFTQPENLLNWAVPWLQKGCDIYVSVNFRDGKGGKRENVSALNALHVDLDFNSENHSAKNNPSEEQARAAVEAFELPPTVVVHSGGGLHLYWKLKKPLADRNHFELAELINKELATALRGDPGVKDVSRILRLPGTLNFKNLEQPREVVLEKDSGPSYEWEEIENWFKRRKTPTLDDEGHKEVSQQTKKFTWDELVSLGFSEQCIVRIMTGFHQDKQSRSERDQEVLYDAVRNNVDKEIIFRIFQTMEIGDKYRQETDPDRYLMRSYEQAKDFYLKKTPYQRNEQDSGKRNKSSKLDLHYLLQTLRIQHHLHYDPAEKVVYQYTGKGYQQGNRMKTPIP